MKSSLLISKYIAKKYIGWFTTLTLCAAVLVTLIDGAELVRQSSADDTAMPQLISKMALLHLPFLISKLTPFITLFTTFIVLWRFNASNQLIALRAVGLSIRQILSPIILLVFCIGVIDASLLNPLTALCTQKYEKIKAYEFYGKKEHIIVSESGMWVRHANQYPPIILKCTGMNMRSNQLNNAMFLLYDEANEFTARLHAKTVQFDTNNTLTLKDGWYVSKDGIIQQFQSYSLKNDLDISTIQENQPKPETFSLWDLPKHINWLKSSGLKFQEYIVYQHSLMSQIVLMIAMVLLAGAFSFFPIRQLKFKKVITTGLTIGFGLYIIKDISNSLGSTSMIHPIVAAWIPSIIGLFFGVSLVFYQEEA